MPVPSDFIKIGAGVGECGGGCLHKCGRGTKSVSGVGYYNFWIPFDHNNASISNASLGGFSFFAPVKYLTLTLVRRFSNGAIYTVVDTWNPLTGTNTGGSGDVPLLNPILVAAAEADGYGGSWTMTDTTFVAQIGTKIPFSSGQAFYYMNPACIYESVTLSNPYTLAQAVTAANNLVASVPLTLPGIYTLTTGETVTFDYPNQPLLPGTTALISGIIANPDGTFSKTGNGLSVFDQFGVAGVSGMVAANALPTSILAGVDYLSYNFPPTVLADVTYNTGTVVNPVAAVNSLATAVKYVITAERTGTIDTQPFQVPMSPTTGELTNPSTLAWSGDVIPPVEPASLNLIPNAEVPISLTGENIFTPADAPAYGVLGVTLKTTSPASIGAGGTKDNAAQQQNIGGGGGGL